MRRGRDADERHLALDATFIDSTGIDSTGIDSTGIDSTGTIRLP
jgi:hypothetical protein